MAAAAAAVALSAGVWGCRRSPCGLHTKPRLYLDQPSATSAVASTFAVPERTGCVAALGDVVVEGVGWPLVVHWHSP